MIQLVSDSSELQQHSEAVVGTRATSFTQYERPCLHDRPLLSPQLNGFLSSSTDVRCTASPSSQRKDPWKRVRTNWFNVLINITTYALLVSDVPRAGTATHLNWRLLSAGVYSYFGSYAYEVITITRNSFGKSNNFTASNNNNPVAHARTWSYTFDTTSTALRLVTAGFNTMESSVLRCMNYNARCDSAGTFSIPETFEMLDHVVSTVATSGDSTRPVIYPPNPDHQFQFLRLAQNLKTRHTYILYDRVTEWFFQPLQVRSVRVSHWPDVNSSFDVCADQRDRPFLCDAGPLSDYRSTGDPADAESSNVTFVWVSINNHVHARYQASQSNRSAGRAAIDVTILEGYTKPWTYAGGLMLIVSAEFEIVVLTRVREWSNPSGSPGKAHDEGTTVQISDYRYEGGIITTDLDDWHNSVSLLRILAQIYYILRVMSLFMACYLAFPLEERSWSRTMLLFFSEVPSHVVAYGSFIPLAMYTLALWIDGTAVNAIIHSGALGLQGDFIASPGTIYTLICLLMRRQWLLAFMTMIWVRVQTIGKQFNRHEGIVSARGHIFGILASMAMVAGYYHPRLRDTRVLGFSQENPHRSVLNAHLAMRDLSNRRLSGFYSDLFAIALSAVVFVFFGLLVRALKRSCSRKIGVVVDSTTPSNPSKQGFSRNIYESIAKKSFFVARTDMLPSTCTTLWGIDGLTCAWNNDLLVSLASTRHLGTLKNPVELARRQMLINIVQLSEPWNLLKIRLGLTRHQVFTYLDVTTQRTVHVVGQLNGHVNSSRALQTSKFQLVGETSVQELGFHQLVQCQ